MNSATRTAADRFMILTATGPVRAVKCGLSRAMLERLVAAGVAKRIETLPPRRRIGFGDLVRVPTMVCYDRA